MTDEIQAAVARISEAGWYEPFLNEVRGELMALIGEDESEQDDLVANLESEMETTTNVQSQFTTEVSAVTNGLTQVKSDYTA